LYKGINLLTFLGMAMTATWLIHLVWAGRGLRYLRLRHKTSEWVFAETPFTLTLEVINDGRQAQFGLTVENQCADQKWSYFIPRLDPGAKIRFQSEVMIPRRGIYTRQSTSIRSGFPFGLVERSIRTIDDEEFVVFPRRGQVHRGLLRRMLTHYSPSVGRARTNPRRHPAAQSDFHGLRSFRSGDSPHWIHWRTSARLGELMVREFEETPDDNLVIVLDAWLPAALEREKGSQGEKETRRQAEEKMEDKAIPPIGVSSSPPLPLSPSPPPGSARQRLEDAISLAATICWEWCQESGNRIVLGVADKNPLVITCESGLDMRRRMLQALAGVSGDPKADVVELAASIRPALPPGPILVLTTSPGNLQPAIEREFHRPVTCIHVTDLAHFDFFEW
jgi:uncharacterized protein (DUF58 family)